MHGSKVVLKSANKNDSNLAREIHHHRQFLHPHIARLYEVIVTETLVWLVLEYWDELYNHLLRTGPMEPAKVQKIFTQLVGAVSYIHLKACVHRDLKLENVLLDKHGNVKLVDFGFTREYEGKSNYLQTWCGTVCYSAPEMLKGEKYAGEKVDVWSLGVIAYALLCGELPFDEDDENETKKRILKEEPKYPDHMPEQAKDLIVKLLSKRPLLRPSLPEILQHPWLAEHAPQQQAILKLQQPPPFTTELEKETLQRMRSAGVDIDKVIENVLAQRCDTLAGWWALLLEKEERKAKRRERKRKEREAEAKSLRRLSAASRASSRLDRLAPTIREIDEEGAPIPIPTLGEPPKSRGRNRERTSIATCKSMYPDLPLVPEASRSPNNDKPPPPVEKDRRVSASRGRPSLPPKEYTRSRRSSSMLHVVTTNPELLGPNGFVPSKRRRKYQQPFLAQLASLKHWFKESAKRARSRSPGSKNSKSPKANQGKLTKPDDTWRPSAATTTNTARPVSQVRPDSQNRASYVGTPQRPRVTTRASSGSNKRASLSPAPMTPRSSYRRSSAGLRGRKSTSSSVSSIRTIHHAHSHSKASSTSSASLASPSVSSRAGRSPHQSVKVLPATPTGTGFPSNIRLVRATAAESAAAFGGLPPPSPGVLFAKKKRSPFKGPGLNLNTGGSPVARSRGEGGSRTSSVQGRKSGELVIAEEDEDILEEEEEEEVEEVEAFSPVLAPGEYLDESPQDLNLSEEPPPETPRLAP
ncbi:putative serine/threonine-protein kinase [Diplodia seriata]|nr:putative serine/threonine-protein kinase [Diplodia seriata]